ncbi:MAG TPA: FecR domain-containing protein [Flavisolibacter sp.]|nr:FecR domain-containing protein [Flavisolibacter sp.]
MKENPYSDMDKEAHRIAYLIAGYIRNTITEKEHDELDDWVNASDHNMQLFEELTDEDNLADNLAWMDKVQSEQSFKQLQESGSFRKTPIRFKLNPMWVAAASVILLAGIAWLLFSPGKKPGDSNTIASADSTLLQPGGNRATLTLANGSTIDITAAKNGLVGNEDGTDIIKTADGQLVYDGDTAINTTSAINMLTTPIGGQYQVKLPDGTAVWLNAATTLKYPARFSANERRVEVEGEAYFEVIKNDKQPFRVVLSDGAQVTVLGTHFNVMTYHNESAKEITLLEGSVSISKNDKTEKLLPGTQLRIAGNTLTKKNGIDTGALTGWKSGLFVFHDAPIESIMRQIERWYGAKVVYQGKISQYFNATILRTEPLPKLLRLLELNGYVRFKTENKTVYVLPR